MWSALEYCSLSKQVLNPFYVFQLFSVCLWFAEDYMEYATAIIIMSLLSISLTVYDLRQVRHLTIFHKEDLFLMPGNGQDVTTCTCTALWELLTGLVLWHSVLAGAMAWLPSHHNLCVVLYPHPPFPIPVLCFVTFCYTFLIIRVGNFFVWLYSSWHSQTPVSEGSHNH